MKRLFSLFAVLLCLSAFASTDVNFVLSEFGCNPTTNRLVSWQMTSPFPGNKIFTNSDAVTGTFTISNIPAGLYQVYVYAPPQLTVMQLNITATNLGFVDALAVTAAAGTSTFPSGQTAWSAAASDLRYARGTNSTGNLTASGNGIAVSGGNNVLLGAASVSLSGNLPNLALTGAVTNPPIAGTNFVVYTNGSGQLVLNGTGTGSGAVTVAATNLVIATTNSGLVTFDAVVQTNGVVLTNYSLPIIVSNITSSIVGILRGASGSMSTNQTLFGSWLNGGTVQVDSNPSDLIRQNGHATFDNGNVDFNSGSAQFANIQVNGSLSGDVSGGTGYLGANVNGKVGSANQSDWLTPGGIITNNIETNSPGISASNHLSDRAIVLQWTTNNLWVSNAIPVADNGTYILASSTYWTNVEDPTRTITNTGSLYALKSGATTDFTASSPASTSWSVVSGTQAPRSGYGFHLYLLGGDIFGWLTSTSLVTQLQATTNGTAIVSTNNIFGLFSQGTNVVLYTNNGQLVINSVPGSGGGGGIATLNGNGTNTFLVAASITNTVYLDTTNIYLHGGTERVYQNIFITNSADGANGAGGVFIGSVDNTQTLPQETSQRTQIGGGNNRIGSSADQAAQIGGKFNILETQSDRTFMGGGSNNYINAANSVIDGGANDSINSTVQDSVNPDNMYAGIFSGLGNSLTNSKYSTILGGNGNSINSATNSVAMGNNAAVSHNATFVWSDDQGSAFSSTARRQFLVRAQNGVGINKNNPGSSLDVSGNINGTSATFLSQTNTSFITTNSAMGGNPGMRLTGSYVYVRGSGNGTNDGLYDQISLTVWTNYALQCSMVSNNPTVGIYSRNTAQAQYTASSVDGPWSNSGLPGAAPVPTSSQAFTNDITSHWVGYADGAITGKNLTIAQATFTGGTFSGDGSGLVNLLPPTNTIAVIHTNTSISFYYGGSSLLNGVVLGTAISNLVAGDTLSIGPGYFVITNGPYTVPSGTPSMPVQIIGSGPNTWMSSANTGNGATLVIGGNTVVRNCTMDNTNRTSPCATASYSAPLTLINATNFLLDHVTVYGHFDVIYTIGQATNQVLRSVQLFCNYDWNNTSSVSNNSTAGLTIYDSYIYGRSNFFSPNWNDGAARHCLITGMALSAYGTRFENGDSFFGLGAAGSGVGLITTADDVNSALGGFVDGATLTFVGCSLIGSSLSTIVKNYGLGVTAGGLVYTPKIPATINLTGTDVPRGTNYGPVNFNIAGSVPVTNIFSITPIPNWTNIYVTGTSDAGTKYTIASGNPSGTNGLAIWTNVADVGKRVYRNDPASLTDIPAVPPCYTISNSAGGELYFNNPAGNASTNYVSLILDQGNGASANAIVTPDTNGFTTNFFYTPSLPTGVTDGNAANAGNIGETSTNGLASGSAQPLVTGVPTNVVTLSLTAGEWDVTGSIGFTANGSTTITVESGGITTSSATLPSLDTGAVVQEAKSITGGSDEVLTLPTKRFRLAGTTTVYLVGKASFGANTLSAYGFLRATRIR